MEKILNIYQRINEVMKEVKYIQKENKKVNGQYTFVSHDAVSSALHEPMAKYGIVMIPSISDLVQDGNKTIVKMDITFINSDNPVDRISLVYYGYGIDPQDKGIGKAVSYAVKYALLKTFCLETGDDVEKDNIDYSVNEQEKTLRTSNALKSTLIKDIPAEDLVWFDKYVVAVEKHLKVTNDQALIKLTEKKDLKGDFYNWKEKQMKQVEEKVA